MHQPLDDILDFDAKMERCRYLGNEIIRRMNALDKIDTEESVLASIAIYQEFQEWYDCNTDTIHVPYNYDEVTR